MLVPWRVPPFLGTWIFLVNFQPSFKVTTPSLEWSIHHGPWPWWCLGSCGWVAFVEMPLVPELTPFAGEVIEHGWRFRKYRQNCNQHWPVQYCMHLTSPNIRALMCLWVYVLCDVVCVNCTESNGPRHMNEATPCWQTSDVVMQD